jgi:hypothetical protein
METFRIRNVYAPFTTFAVDMRQQNTETMYFSEMFDIEADKSAQGLRDLWFNTSYMDSRQFAITCERHYGKIALFKYDEWITYWRKRGGDLRQIARTALGVSISDVIDELTRDAYLSGPFYLISGHESGTKSASGYPNFGTIEATDTFNPDDLAKIFLIMDAGWNIPFANDPTGVSDRALFAVTTPGVWYDLITDDTLNFREKLKTMQDARILRYEVGQYLNTRYLKTSRNILWNCGPITKQTTLTANVAIGSGAAQVVDNHYTTGQQTLRTHSGGGGNNRYISVADATGIKVGDIITLHKTRTGKYGVPNGVDFNEGTLTNRRVVEINGNNIGLDKPVLRCEYDSGHYVTKARHIHATVVIGGPRAVVWGVTQPPSLYNPPTIDDGMGQVRFTWDAYMKCQQFRPEMAYVIFSAGSSPEGMLPTAA